MTRQLVSKSIFLMSVVALLIFILPIVGANPVVPEDWMDVNTNPLLLAQWSSNQDTYNEEIAKDYDTCTQKTVTTRPARPGQSQRTVSRCWYKTSMGLISGEYVVATGENIAGQVTGRVNSGSTSNIFYPTPKDNIVLDRWSNSLTNTYKFHYNPTLTKTVNSNGTVSYHLSSSDTFTLTGHDSSDTWGTFDVSYSRNGKYALFSRNTNLVRVDLDTKMILTYGAPSGWYPGNQMNSKAAITDSGEYALVTSREGSGRWMKVFDLNDCVYEEYSYVMASTPTGNCTSRDFKNHIESSISSFNYIMKGEFIDEKNVEFFHRSSGTPQIYTKYIMSIDSGTSAVKYMALGDSFSSGEGAFNYIYPTDTGDNFHENACHLSAWSYPQLISDRIDPQTFTSFACSGATLINVGGSFGIKNDATHRFKDNQYYHEDRMGSTYVAPGYSSHRSKVSAFKPNVITLSIGGNDIGFENKIKKCLQTGASCYKTYEQRKEIANEVNGIFYRATNVFKRLKKAAPPGARIYVVGYPYIATTDNNCGTNVNSPGWELDEEERELSSLIIDRLNMVIERAANRTGLRFVDVSNAFAGRRLCEPSDKKVAVNGLTAGRDQDLGGLPVRALGNESFHPNLLGQRMLRDAVLAATNDLTQPMPAPDSSITKPAIDDSIPLLNGAPKTNRPLKGTILDFGIAPDVTVRGVQFNTKMLGSDYGLRSGTVFTYEMHSSPVSLGTFTSDDNGNLDMDVTLPSNTEPGFHTLHIYGKDVDNNDVDIYKTIYVAATDLDWDGDGIDNEQDQCITISLSGLDADNDGIDDACDPVLWEIPEEEPLYIYGHNRDILAKYRRPEEVINA